VERLRIRAIDVEAQKARDPIDVDQSSDGHTSQSVGLSGREMGFSLLRDELFLR
jgi:hypothetical protein